MKPKPLNTLPDAKAKAPALTPEEFLAQSLKLLEALSRLRMAGESNRRLAAAWFQSVGANPDHATVAHKFYK